MNHLAPGFREIVMVCMTLMILSSCGRDRGSKGNSLTDCGGLFGKAYNECINSKSGFDSISASLSSQLGAAGGMMVKSMIGSVISIRYAGDYKDCNVVESQSVKGCGMANLCLSASNEYVKWEACDPFKIDQQFHFIEEIPIKFNVHAGINHESVAFRIATRASIRSHYQSANDDPNHSFRCLRPTSNSVNLVNCDESPYFMTLMNRYDDDDDMARKKENQYISLVSLIRDTKKIEEFKEAQKEEPKSFLDEIFEDEKTKEEDRNKEAQRVNRKYLDLGSFLNRKDCYDLRMISNIKGKAVGSCLNQDIREDQNNNTQNHLFIHPCGDPNLDKSADCKGLDPIKNYYDFVEGRQWGVVVKILPKSEEHVCLQAEGQTIKEIDNCNKNAPDNPSIQFRSEIVGSDDLKNGKSLVKLRSMMNLSMCADLSSHKLVDCRNAPKLTFDPVSNDLSIKTGNIYKSYFMSMCDVATSHKKNGRYDCQREVPWKYQLYDKLSIGLAFIPYVGFIPSAVFNGLLCTSNEEQYAEAGCIGLGLDLSLSILFGDIMPLPSLLTKAFKTTYKSGKSIVVNNILSSSSQLALSRASMRTGYSSESMKRIFIAVNRPVIDFLAKGQLSGKQLLEVFKKARTGDHCLGTNCNGWWNPAPKTGEDTLHYLNQLKSSMTHLKFNPQEKNNVLKAIEQAKNP